MATVLPTPSSAAVDKGYCEFLLDGSSDDSGFATFHANPFYYGGLLLEFFGPTNNGFHKWLKWLESDDADLTEPSGPGVFIGGNGRLILAKEMRYPFDGGISEFSGDPSKKMIVPLMELYAEGAQGLRGSSEKAKAARQKLLQALDVHLFGLYGAKEANTYDKMLMRSIKQDHLLHASRIYDRNVKVTPDFMGSYQGRYPAPGNPVEDMKQVAEVVAQDNHTVTVKVDLGKKPLNQNQDLIQKMFFLTHWQMVQKAYRETRLFEDSLESSLYLLDDFIKSMNETKGGEQIFLLYPAEAWHSMVYRMSAAHRYAAIDMPGIGRQPYFYQRISDVFYPFYPTYGMLVERYADNSFELKRLFHNPNPDPLNFLRADPVKRHKHYFYHEVAKNLPAQAVLKAISKSPLHTRLYKSIGFKLVESVWNEEWKCNKDTLKMTREEYLENTLPK